MPTHTLSTDDGLRAAIASIGPPTTWIGELSETLRWFRAADEATRAGREFQRRLWEDNHVAAAGQGTISVEKALDSADFRAWLAQQSMVPLPATYEEQVRLLTDLYQALKTRLEPSLDKRVPHLKMFRVLAVMYPEVMTTVADISKLRELTSALGGGRSLGPVERHVWVRRRLAEVGGDVGSDPTSLAERMALPWMLYERFVQKDDGGTAAAGREGDNVRLVPLPAAVRRKGLTPIKGQFPGVLSSLDFIRDGVTRQELLDFLRASNPDVKASGLGITINVYQSELGVIRLDGDRYVLTERGENVLESQDPTYLADWLLTRVLGVDKPLAELRDRGPMTASALFSTIQSMNPGWTGLFVPQSIVSWLRSMGVLRSAGSGTYELTDIGRQWAARIHWTPEPLKVEPPNDTPLVPIGPPLGPALTLKPLTLVVDAIQNAGHFPSATIARLHAGLWSHPRRHFAILTGLSGSGKTLLAREYARAIAPEPAARLLTLPVQPGWYDPGPLLGYVNPLRSESYVSTPFLEFLIVAAADPGRPYVVVLDEMNLSHPEQYMAPLLSAMETGEPIKLQSEDTYFDGIPESVAYPSNLVLIGTVNMDETTHGLSDKVLDRAFVMEFWDVDLESYPRWNTRKLPEADERLAREALTALMESLAPARLHFGWRVVDDVLDFLVRATDTGSPLTFPEALDGVVYAKVLPKLRGEDSPRFRDALTACEAALDRFGLATSRAKVAELRQDLITTGSARFWR